MARPSRQSIGGMLLLGGTAVALMWANSPWSESYDDLWAADLPLRIGGRVLVEDLRHWVNDVLMVGFFFVVGLEIKQELVAGHLARARLALLPAVAALGGMVVPAAIYLAFNLGSAGSRGWAIPMATDIAFAVGVLALLGDRVPSGLPVFLLALAVADDIGAVAVIGVWYSEEIRGAWALSALAGVALIAWCIRLGVRSVPLYGALGFGVWLATLGSGIHATVAGVALGLLCPARGVNAAERLRDGLQPWTALVILPLFALANAGLELSDPAVGDAASSSVTFGVIVGLLVGKPLGITAAVMLATRFRIAVLPAGVGMGHIAGAGCLAGIGFTVSLFIADLAFEAETLRTQAKLGILIASTVAAVIGIVALRLMPRR